LNKKNNSISVLLRCKNEERWIGHTIQSILDFVDQPEIIVLDNNSSDNSMDIVKHFSRDKKLKNLAKTSYTNIQFTKIDDYSPGSSLNRGVKLATNNLVMIISSHCVIKQFDFNKLEKNMKSYDCVFGNQIPIYYGKRINKRYVWSHFVDKEVVNMYSNLEKRYFIHNGFAIYKKNILTKIPFNENLVGKEDRYWGNDFVKRGNKYLYDNSLIVEHHYTPNGNTWKGLA